MVGGKKICPVMEKFEFCVEERCAWWDEARGQCVVMRLASGEYQEKLLGYLSKQRYRTELYKGEQCELWILQTLEEAGGPVRTEDMVKRAQEAGFSKSTLYRARARLRSEVVDTRGSYLKGNEWVLADVENEEA